MAQSAHKQIKKAKDSLDQAIKATPLKAPRQQRSGTLPKNAKMVMMGKPAKGHSYGANTMHMAFREAEAGPIVRKQNVAGCNMNF